MLHSFPHSLLKTAQLVSSHACPPWPCEAGQALEALVLVGALRDTCLHAAVSLLKPFFRAPVQPSHGR